MANTAYTDKQLADHLAAFERGEGLPENSILDFGAARRGEPVLRKMTPEEVKRGRAVRVVAERPVRPGAAPAAPAAAGEGEA